MCLQILPREILPRTKVALPDGNVNMKSGTKLEINTASKTSPVSLLPGLNGTVSANESEKVCLMTY